MAFNKEYFSVRFLNQSKTHSTFDYATEDSIIDLVAAGYFNEVYDILKVNDRIIVSFTNIPRLDQLRVSSNVNGVVTVVDNDL